MNARELAPPERGGPGYTPPLRALIVTAIYPWAAFPDEGIFVHRQVQRLAALGVECHVLLFRPAVRGLPESLRKATWLRYHPRWMGWPTALDGIPVDLVFHRSHWRRGHDLVPLAVDALARHMDQHLRGVEFDVILGHWLWSGGAVAVELGARLGVPVAAIARGSEMHDWLGERPHCRRHVRQVLERADLLLANCEGLRRRAAGLLPGSEERMGVVYNGCDVERFRPSDDVARTRRRLGLPVGRRLLLFCGRVQRTKGAYELAEAWEQTAHALDDWELLVTGAVTERAAARALARAGRRGGRRVRIVGPVASEIVCHYMQAADAMVHPTHAEGLANATMEAMACGVPVISSDVDGQPELIEDGVSGWLIPPGETRALVRALHEMAGDPAERLRRGRNARRRIVEHFDSRVHAAHLRSVLAHAARPREERQTVG